MDDFLELVGVDSPLNGTPGVVQPQRLNTGTYTQGMSTAVNSQGMQQALGNAPQQLGQSLGQFSQNVQSKAQSELATIQTQQQSKLQQAMVTAQRQAQQGDVLSSLAQTASQYLLQRKQMDETRKLKAQEEAARLLAQQQAERYEQVSSTVYQLVTEGEAQGYNKYGTQRYTNDVEKLIQENGISGRQAEDLRKMAYESAQKHNQTVNTKLEKEQDDARTAIVEAKSQQMKFSLISTLSEFGKNPYQDPQQMVDIVVKQAQTIQEDASLTGTQKVQLLGRLYGDASPYLEKNREAASSLNVMRYNLEQYRLGQADIWEKQQKGEITYGEAKVRESALGKFYGIDGVTYDPTEDVNFKKSQESLTQVSEEKRKGLADEVNTWVDRTVPFSDKALNAKANNLAFYQGGAQLAVLQAKKDKTQAEILLVSKAEAIQRTQKEVVELGAKQQAMSSELERIRASNIEDLLKMQQQGKASPGVNDFFATLFQNNPEVAQQLSAGSPMSQADIQLINNAKTQYANQKAEEGKLITQQLQQAQATLAQFGLAGADAAKYVEEGLKEYEETMKKRNKAAADKLAEVQKMSTQQPTVGYTSPFNTGTGEGQNQFSVEQPPKRVRTDLPTVPSLGQAVVHGKKILLPVAAADQRLVSFTGKFGEDRGSHKHAGMDIAAKEGTPIITPVNGTVVRVDPGINNPNGYGHYVDVLGADGMLYRYAHIQAGSIKVAVGDGIRAGTQFARVGNTGRSSGAHTHFEVRDPKQPFGFEGTVDPVAYLANLNQKPSTLGKARSSGLPQVANVDGSVNESLPIPATSMPLGGKYYVHEGQVYSIDSPQPTTAQFNHFRPLANSYMTTPKPGTRVKNDPSANLGYKQLAQDNELRKALHQVASDLNIPSEWLADIVAYESDGKFTSNVRGVYVKPDPKNPSRASGRAVGLIQFMPSTLKDMGSSENAAASMSAAQQMKTLVKQYFMSGKKEVGEFKNIAEMYLYVFGGGDAVRSYRKNPNDYNTDDGYNDFKSISKQLGSRVGRQHDIPGVTRKERISTHTHTTYTEGCKTCESLRASNSSIVPHQAQMSQEQKQAKKQLENAGVPKYANGLYTTDPDVLANNQSKYSVTSEEYKRGMR